MNARPHLDPLHPARHLRALHTPLGDRAVYDSISFCNRCGCCSQACFSYRMTQDEAFSPRGRNQLARLLAEGKLKKQDNPALIQEAVRSCSLCGTCTAACAGKIPTAEHMLELRRALRLRLLPTLLHTLLTWRETAPKRFDFILRAGNFLRNAGLLKPVRLLQLTRLAFLTWLPYADDILPRRITFLKRRLKKAAYARPDKPGVIYLPSLEAEYFDARIALVSLTWLEKKHPLVWLNRSAGLFSYLYGDVRQARKTARNLLRAYAQTGGKLPLVTDSIDVYNLLTRYPQLFSGNAFWQKKAEAFVKNVRFIADYFPAKNAAASGEDVRARLEETALLGAPEDVLQRVRKIFKTQFKKNFVQYSYNELAAPPAGYGFVNPVCARTAFYAKMKDTARTRTNAVFTLSGLSALELDYWLKKHYLCSTAQHLTRLNG